MNNADRSFGEDPDMNALGYAELNIRSYAYMTVRMTRATTYIVAGQWRVEVVMLPSNHTSLPLTSICLSSLEE